METSHDPGRVIPRDALPCVWMSAGLVSYRLCDREFDCDTCPLDQALRGASPTSRPEHSGPMPSGHIIEFPDDRHYSSGHLWVQECGDDGEELRIGIDGFASELVGRCLAVRCGNIPRQLEHGGPVFEIDLPEGTLLMGAPCECQLVRGNSALAQHPEQVTADPYGDGWIAHIISSDGEVADNFLSPENARDQARMDLRGFRRRAALYLLTDTLEVGACLPDGGAVLTDMRQLLGGARYLQLIRELAH